MLQFFIISTSTKYTEHIHFLTTALAKQMFTECKFSHCKCYIENVFKFVR
jgi:hypothetical protein